ncbi:Spy/CpxP family protein refolding chaperone [Shewanella glacialimarina]|jgi:protein CpxP|uniref:Spy/CpxP family protein refolding chaperone n=1 Tax=Shewanella glacialimarina TaxID=2590884 RepID=UPI001CF916FC|nr:Spy/CpxP family protein refolding chaperone [Shewanella glacialimarina]UCX03267.1 spheroplast protein y [Shewanella glacialimarina]
MKTSSIFKKSLVALVASSALLAGQLYAEETISSAAKTEQSSVKADRHHGHKGGMHKMLRKLDLTDAQKVQFKVIFDKYKANRPEHPTKEQRAAHKADRLALITTAGFDEVKATEMVEAKQQMQLQKMLTQMKIQNEIYQLLTPEQQQTFQDKFNSGKGHKPHD